MNLSSMKMKMILLISVFGVVISIIMGITEPMEAKRIGNNILIKDAEFISNLLSENLALGMQTRVLDNGAALEQTLSLLRNKNHDQNISNVWVFDNHKKYVTSLAGRNPGNIIPSAIETRTIIDKDRKVDVWSRLYDSDKNLLGYVGINFSKQYLLSEARKNMYMAMILGLLLIIGTTILGIFMGKNIGQPLSRMSLIAEGISRGDIDHTINPKILGRNDEIGILAKAFTNLIVHMKNLANVATRIAQNDLTAKVEPKSDKDVVGLAFQTMCRNLAAMVRDLSENANTLASASNELASSPRRCPRGSTNKPRR